MIVTINIILLLGVIIVLRLRRRVEARSRMDEKMTVLIVLVFGVLVAPTDFGQWILSMVGQMLDGIENTRF